MAQAVAGIHDEKKIIRVPEWLYLVSDEQFVQWCKERKVQVCAKVREFPEDERAAIFRYMVRQHLVN